MVFFRSLSSLFIVFIFCSPSYGQSHIFTKKAAPGQIVSRFGHTYAPSFAFGDIDSDGDEDVIVTGTNRFILPDYYSEIHSIYINDGNGAFQATSSNCFPEARDVPVFLHDVDGDNDLDFILAGILQGPSMALYLNDGMGGFKASDSVTFPTYTDYDVALGDLNNDGVMDIVVSSSQFEVYLGDGNGGFKDTVLPQVDGLTDCAVMIGDLNNDGMSDIIATGKDNGAHAFRYYQGQGNLSFTEITTSIPGLSEDPSLALGDVNNDGYLDIGIMGEDPNRNPVTSLYLSDLGLTFTPDTIPNLLQLQEGNIHLVDFTGDGELDIFATGVVSFSTGGVCALENNGTNWTSVATDDFVNLQDKGSSAFCDVNGDNLPELFLGGMMRDISYKTSYIITQYLNHGNGEFYRTDGSHFWNAYTKYWVEGDFTGDGYLDIIAYGSVPSGPKWIEGYENDGSGNFGTVSTNLPFYRISEVASIDANGDSYKDIVTYHDWNNGPTVFMGSAGGMNFIEDLAYIDYSYEGGISVGDVDGDGDDDFTYMTQLSWNSHCELNVMLNDGTGSFSKLSLSSPPRIQKVSKTMFADFNNDGYADLFFPNVKRLFHWDQSITEYVEDTVFPSGAIPHVTPNTVASPYTTIADFDQNGRFDVMIGFDGSNGTGGAYFDLILQDTSGIFTYDSTFNFPPSEVATIDTADFDLDGDIDVVYVGTSLPHSDYLAMILENDGQGNFSEYPFHELTRMSNFSWFMDVDNDGDKDIMQVGTDHNRTRFIGQVHENHVCLPIKKDTAISTCSSSFKWGVTGCAYTVSGKYKKTFVNAQNCFEMYSLDLEINGFEAEVNTVDTGFVCIIDTFTSYQWYDCSNGSFTPVVGDTSFTFYPVNNGSYALVATNAEGCTDTTECFVINTISAEEFVSDEWDIGIYPNPTSSYIQVEGLNNDGYFEVFDLSGRKMLSGTLKPNGKHIDISTFNKGVYLLKIISDEHKLLTKVLKI